MAHSGRIWQCTEQDLTADEQEECHGPLDCVANPLGRDEDHFGILCFDPVDGQQDKVLANKVLANNLEQDTDSEDNHSSADRLHTEEQEE